MNGSEPRALHFVPFYSFRGGKNGGNPEAAPIRVGKALYGTTSGSLAPKNYATAFSITDLGLTYRVLHNFGLKYGSARPIYSALTGVSGIFYGTTAYGTTLSGSGYGNPAWAGQLFSISKAGARHILHHFHFYDHNDGSEPLGGLINVDGTLYGTTFAGGEYFAGTVFAISTSGARFRILHSFGGPSDSSLPSGALVYVNGELYGTTHLGGPGNGGAVFSLETSGSGYRVLYSFDDAHGRASSPNAPLLAVGNLLYGTTNSGGGVRGGGAIFRIGLSGSGFAVLHRFEENRDDNDGFGPSGALVATSGRLYGTTVSGGTSMCNCGTVFSITESGYGYRVIHRFRGHDGSTPEGLISANGSIYGTTFSGGSRNSGTIFELTP
ncbi:MAG: hypothetical protein JO092_01425 [Candidatus Eremiobacteraeota bacterium]|nr:hypothetical protein [Candidatus Eremiobacteraeota bacterium]